MSNIPEKIKKIIEMEKAALKEDRARYNPVPSWGVFFLLLAIGLLLTAVTLAGGFD